MKFLYAPWRSKYLNYPKALRENEAPRDSCIFCGHIKTHKDKEHFIVRRFNNFMVMLNLYPYNQGHLLITALDHISNITDFTPAQRRELMELINASTDILQSVLHTEGINIGINIGRASGAGLPSHFHAHVLPRWIGDTNFLPLLADTKQISIDLPELYNRLKPHFDKLSIDIT